MPNTEGIFDYITSFYNAGVENVGGGLLGGIISAPISQSFNDNIAYIVLIGIVAVTTVFITGITISSIIIGIKDKLGYLIDLTRKDYRDMQKQKRKSSEKFKNIISQSEIIEAAEQLNFKLDESEAEEDEEADPKESNTSEEIKKNIKDLFNKKIVPEKEVSKAEELILDHNTIEEYEEYEFPTTELLNAVKHIGKDFSNKELKEIAIKLQKTLASFGVDARVTNVTRGPTVTRYELQPNVGVKVSKILNLADDIALNLAAKSIRIEAPIPGKSAVGIEVPNKTNEIVGLRDIIESDEFIKCDSKVSFSLGRAIDGMPFIADIVKMPHLLIAGSTGSGKSVCINSLIMSLLYKANPSEVKLMLIDPKVVELGVYNGIPHLLIPVVTDPKKAAGALNWAVQEMVNRYNLFASRGVRDIKGYNEVLRADGEEGVLPQIVIIIDELADLMMVAPDEVEDAICRLAQMARAAGMHLVIATQRPSVDVITGIIKANIPSRIAFTVSSQVDSRTILDMAGAEKLLGKGDMLFFPVGESKPIRIQGSYVSDKEIESVVDFIKSNNTERYNEDIIEKIENKNNLQGQSSDDCDELLTDAIELAINMGQASASMIQRRFKVGYARAGRIVDQMEARGIVSGYDGSKPRTTLISKEEWEETKNNMN
jgi:S-DNA-T family DNA segregation ATPase FtsK/SpoIIIE